MLIRVSLLDDATQCCRGPGSFSNSGNHCCGECSRGLEESNIRGRRLVCGRLSRGDLDDYIGVRERAGYSGKSDLGRRSDGRQDGRAIERGAGSILGHWVAVEKPDDLVETGIDHAGRVVGV